MNKYRRVTKEKEKKETPENVIRVTAQGRSANYISYAAKIFNEKNHDSLQVVATGTALPSAVTISEILKRRFKGLHQITKTGTIEIIDEYEPLEEGLVPVKDVRNVSFLEVTLSKVPLDTKDKGYQPPLPEDQVKEVTDDDLIRPRGRGRGRSRGKKGAKGSKERGSSKGGKKGGSKGGSKGKVGGKGNSKSQSKGASRQDSKGRSVAQSKGKSGKGSKGKSPMKGESQGKGSKGKSKSQGKSSSAGKGGKDSKGKGSKGTKGSKKGSYGKK